MTFLCWTTNFLIGYFDQVNLFLPRSKWLLIFLLNVIWWTLPIGFSYELLKSLSAYAPDPNADSPGIVIFPLFGLWFLLWIALNVVLILKSRLYPAGASILIWDSSTNYRSILWTLVCAAFLLLYISLIR